MIEKLKTLKDLKYYSNDTNYPTIHDLVSIKDIKQEGIKWIEEDIKDTEGDYILSVDALINRWMERLNITEEDLK